MKKMSKLMTAVLMSALPLTSQASSYEEEPIAVCFEYQLIEKTVTTREFGGTTREFGGTTREDRSYGLRNYVTGERVEEVIHELSEDKDIYRAALNSETDLRITRTFQRGEGKVFEAQVVSWGQAIQSQRCQTLK